MKMQAILGMLGGYAQIFLDEAFFVYSLKQKWPIRDLFFCCPECQLELNKLATKTIRGTAEPRIRYAHSIRLIWFT